MILFFFKQKTAYEMRISDWSSDVCSSDLVDHGVVERVGAQGREDQDAGIEQRPRNRQNPHPDAGHRQVQDQQHEVADIEAGDQAPDQVRLVGEQERAGLQTVLLEGGDEIGRASGRDRVCQYVEVSVGAGALKKKITKESK